MPPWTKHHARSGRLLLPGIGAFLAHRPRSPLSRTRSASGRSRGNASMMTAPFACLQHCGCLRELSGLRTSTEAPDQRAVQNSPSSRRRSGQRPQPARTCTSVLYTGALQLTYVTRRSPKRRQRRTPNRSSGSATNPRDDSSARLTEKSPVPRSKRRSSPAPVGARVARVAVDDATWAAFRELCGATPASVRLAQLVEAEVRRARASTPASEALAAIESIRDQAAQVEAFVRGSAGQG